jgi:hypothetical protein
MISYSSSTYLQHSIKGSDLFVKKKGLSAALTRLYKQYPGEYCIRRA